MIQSQVPGAPPHKFQVQVAADSFITKLHLSISNGLPHSTPLSTLHTHEHRLVASILQMLQGFPTSFFYWDPHFHCFHANQGIHVSHLSQTTLNRLFNPFLLAASCFKRVEIFVTKVQSLAHRYPTLSAFANSVNSCLKRLRDGALKEEELLFKPDNQNITTLLELLNSLSSLCAGAEHLCQIIYEAVPGVIFDADTTMINMLPSEVAVHILNHLFNKLSNVCLVQGGEGDPYQMLLFLFVGTLLPYLRSLDSWLYDGILDDPFEEMFFCGNTSVSIDQPSFWETSYLLRSKPRSSISQGGSTFTDTCPKIFATMSKAIISAGKSLQLVHHAQDQSFVPSSKTVITCDSPDKMSKSARAMGILTLAEVFLISLVGLTNDRDHIFEKLIKYSIDNHSINMDKKEQNSKAWLNFLSDAIEGRIKNCLVGSDLHSFRAFNPAVTVCGGMLENNKSSWEVLNISGSFYLPPLNDSMLRKAVFGGTHLDDISRIEGTDYRFGFSLGEIDRLHMEEEDKRALEGLCAFPTILPSFPEDKPLSEILPFQKDSTLSSRVLKFIQNMNFKESLDPAIMIQECLGVYIKRQVDHVGRSILRKLMGEWRLMDELCVLRAIYLLGSGDLLQQFLVVIFNMLDKGDSWDDDFELNTLLQDSIRNSADKTLLSAPDSLTVSVSNESTNTETRKQSTQENVGSHNLGIDSLDKLCFSYKVSWPLDLIANVEALRKYNQVMGFLLKVKRAKFLLDKTRTWRWKDRSTTQNYKKHLLIEQKLLHFVDSFHHYVMDRVYHSAWTELCSGMELAGSLDEVIEVHETYLSSIQRQCFIASDKLWALIAIRVKTILGLALDFYNVKQSLRTAGTSAAIEARCEAEINRVEKQFDDCVAFLLRILSFKLNVGHFPHLADLVTRINYNYFYMSDSGNLLTVPRFESTGNFGKAPAFRPSPS